jgi:quercetin dioxygenase-like cupin family protein
MESVEHITWDGKTLALVIRADANPRETTFLTPPEFNFQVGFVVYPEGGEIVRHAHLPLERHIVGTSEVLIVKKGRCEIDIYNDDQQLVTTYELRQGDLILVVNGGHGFRMLEDTILLEIKQGPYIGLGEKERF